MASNVYEKVNAVAGRGTFQAVQLVAYAVNHATLANTMDSIAERRDTAEDTLIAFQDADQEQNAVNHVSSKKGDQ
jgi:hypothetical protein